MPSDSDQFGAARQKYEEQMFQRLKRLTVAKDPLSKLHPFQINTQAVWPAWTPLPKDIEPERKTPERTTESFLTAIEMRRAGLAGGCAGKDRPHA